MLHILFLFLYLPVVAQQPIEEGHKLINGVELYYQIIGEGEPIVLLHGGPGMDESYFHPGIDPLGKSYRLITYDQRGAGKSKGPLDTLQLTADQFVEDLEGLRQALELEKMHLMGHSWGGLLAMFYAIKYPEHLQSLLLVTSAGADTSFSKSHIKTAYERLSPEDREAIAKMTEAGYFNSKEGLIKVFKILWKPFVADQQKVKLIKDAVSDHTSLIQKHVGKSIEGYNLYQQLSTLKIPTLILHGDYDPVPLAAVQKIHQTMKDSKLVVLKDCGHFPFIEQQQIFTNTVIEFLQSIKKR